MANAMVALATYRVTGTTDAEVVFASIPSTYRDLTLTISCLGDGGNGLIKFQFNGDTASNYVNVGAYGEAPSASGSYSNTADYIYGSLTSVSTTNTQFSQLQILDYSATDKHKTTLGRIGFPAEDVGMNAGRWASTSAVNQIRVYFGGTGKFAIGSQFDLYGIVS